MDIAAKIRSQAEEMFMRLGIRSVSMDDIARGLGISKKTLYQFIDNKEDLINQVIESHIIHKKAQIQQITAESKDAIDELLTIGKYIIQELRQWSPSTMYDLKKYYGSCWLKMESLHKDQVYQSISNNIQRGIAEGLYRSDTHVDIIARIYFGSTRLMMDEYIFPKKEFPKETLIHEFIHYHIRGIASPKGLQYLENSK